MANEKDKLDRWRDLDFYGALGIDSSVSVADVKKAFRKVALTCHPDKVPEECRAEATKRFQLIGEAYEVLSNPSLRRSYDRVRPKGSRSRGGKDKRAPAPPAAHAAAYRAESPLGIGAPCDGCARCVPVRELDKCVRCANLICRRCDLCAECRPVAPRAPAAAKPKTQAGPDVFAENLRGREPRERPAPKPWTGLGAAGPEKVCAKPERPAKERADAKRDPALLTALLAMGFAEEAARAAAARCSTVESAVEFVMSAEAEARNEEPEAAEGTGDPVDAMMAAEADLVPEREGIPGSPPASPNGRAARREDDLDRQEILLAMGFREEDVEAAMARCSSMDACVELIMSKMPQAQPRQAKGADELEIPAGAAPGAASPEEDIVASLVSLGFSDQQAKAARRRCSSLEAAVDWIAAHPEAAA